MLKLRPLVFVVFGLLSSCGGGELEITEAAPVAEKKGPLVVEAGCQPILADVTKDEYSAQGTCLLPYPSDFYLRNGRITMEGAAKPRKQDGSIADPHDVVAQDGASLVPTIVGTLRGSKVVREGLPSVLDGPEKSTTLASPTLIMKADDGTLVPHFTDLHERAPADEERKPMVLRPIVPLAPKTRYIVAFHGVRAETGVAGAPEGFRRLRDAVKGDPAIEAIAARYEADVFAPLAKAGVARSELQLAWDFTTGSAEQPMTDMLAIREQTLAWLGSNTPTVSITSVAGTDPQVLKGTMTAPLFLEEAKPGALLKRDAAGKVVLNGTTAVPFRVVVPKAVRDAGAPARALGYGHGFFGTTEELESGGAKKIAETVGAVLFGIEWWGMSKDDLGAVAGTLGAHPDHVSDFAERVHQAIANWLVFTSAIKGPLAKTKELAGLYDPGFVPFVGISQGHILGGTMIAMNPDISRAVLNVGGGGFTHIMSRSANFGPFALLIQGTFPDALMTQAFIAMFQRPLDRIDPVTYAPLVFRSPLPGSPERRVVLQTGLGDPGVPNIAAFLHARALGVKQTMPSAQKIALLDETAGGGADSTITVYDFGIDQSGATDPAPLPPNPVHDGLRSDPSALKQMKALLQPGGVAIQPCDGPCRSQ